MACPIPPYVAYDPEVESHDEQSTGHCSGNMDEAPPTSIHLVVTDSKGDLHSFEDNEGGWKKAILALYTLEHEARKEASAPSLNIRKRVDKCVLQRCAF